ncbi:hypothetical protein [Diaphorobacter sp.]|uniref:hypothetical protein n=1 Tax=Diaphorobacter sp. TaxID=1934310 RepID=UPI003D1195DA
MRFAPPHRTAALAALTALASTASPTWAQVESQPAPPTHAVAADSAQAPGRPLRHPLLPASGSVAADTEDWKSANATVGTFANGHADIVRWEAAQARTAPPASTQPAPGHHHNHHGGRP